MVLVMILVGIIIVREHLAAAVAGAKRDTRSQLNFKLLAAPTVAADTEILNIISAPELR
jgi:hypothetical protein